MFIGHVAFPFTSSSPNLRCDIGLEEEEYGVYSIVYYYNGAQRYEQLLQVGQLYWALISVFRSPIIRWGIKNVAAKFCQ